MKRALKILFILGIVGLFLGVSAFVSLLIFSSPTPKQKVMICFKRLKTISAALHEYASDYDGYFPDKYRAGGFEQLRKNNYMTDCKSFTSPLAKEVIVGTSGCPLAEENVSYIYLGGFSNKDNPDMPLVFEKLHNYDPHVGQYSKFICILLLDGRRVGYGGHYKKYSDVITMLNEKYKYSPEDLKRLKEKAAKLDGK